MRAPSRKLLLIFLAVAALGFLLYRSRALVHLSSFSAVRLLHAIRQADISLLMLSVVAIYACYAIRSLRWQVFQKNLGPSHFWTIYRITLAGFSSIFLLGRAGEPIRPLLLARTENLPVAGVFGIYVLERLFDFASTAVIAIIGLLLFKSHAAVGSDAQSLEAAAKTAGFVLSTGLLFAIAALVYLRLHGTALLERKLQPWLASQGGLAKLARIILGFARGVQAIRSWRELALATLYSALHWFLVLMIYVWIIHGFGGDLAKITLGDAMLVLAFTLVGSIVQLPAVGGGSQAGTVAALTIVFFADKELALAVALVIWLVTFASCSLAGVPLLLAEGWSLGQLRRMVQQQQQDAN